jgi:histone arginine demethylase JMJD6
MNANRNIQPMPIVENPDYKTVLEQYIMKNKPVLLRGVAKDWVAFTKWTGPQFAQLYGETKVEAFCGDEIKVFTLADYLDYMHTTTAAQPFYLKDWSFVVDLPELANDYEPPAYFENWIRRIPNERLIGEGFNYLFRWLYIGGKNSGSPMHQDIFDTCAWNAVLSGKKEWLFFAPNETENLYGGKVNGFDPDLEAHPDYLNAQGYTCIQEPGDIMYTPGKWWHQVANLEPGMSITENYINASNVKTVGKYYAQAQSYVVSQDEDPKITQVRQYIDNTLREFIPEMFSAQD